MTNAPLISCMVDNTSNADILLKKSNTIVTEMTKGMYNNILHQLKILPAIDFCAIHSLPTIMWPALLSSQLISNFTKFSLSQYNYYCAKALATTITLT